MLAHEESMLWHRRHVGDIAWLTSASSARYRGGVAYKGQDALTGPDGPQWEAAIEVKMGAHKKRDTYSACRLLPGRSCVGTKMVLDIERWSTAWQPGASQGSVGG